MSWVRLDDRFPSHRKVALLSDRAFRLHVSALCWCAENLTDGHVGERELPLVARLRNLQAAAKELVDAGLWDRVDGGWLVHDYLDYNPSRDQVLAERKKNAERQERFRRRKAAKPSPPNGAGNGRSNGVTNGVTKGQAETKAKSNRGQTRREGDMNAYGNQSAPGEEPQVDEPRNAVSNDAPSPTPTPYRADLGGSSTGSRHESAPEPAGSAPIDTDDFNVTDTMRRWALKTFGPAIDIDHSTAQFVSHYRSTGVRRTSWPDAWQKWIRDDAKKASERPRRLRAVGETPEERGVF
jgi:hypothetical protein